MKICKNCRTRMDDIHTVCPECNCEEFDIAEAVKEGDVPDASDDGIVDKSPTKIIDVEKIKAESIEADESETQTSEADGYEDFQENLPRKVNPKTLAIIIGVAVVLIGALIAVLSGAFSGTNKHYNNAKVDTPADIVTEASDTAVKNTSIKMSEEPFDLQIKIESSVYQVPMMVKDVLLSGWAFGDASAAEAYLASGETVETYMVSQKGSIIFVTVKNFGSGEASVNDSCLIALRVDSDCLSGEKAQLVKGLSMGSLQKAVEGVFGECDDVTEANKGTTLVYTPSDDKTASFVFDVKTKKLISVSYFNDSAPDGFKDATENVEETEASEDGEYTKPTALGNDVAAGVIQIEGGLYKFPIPVSEFLDNGWELTFEEDRAILFAEEHLFGTLKKGDTEITNVDVYNFEKSESRIKNCYVVSLDDSTDLAYGIELPKKVKVGMSEDDFLSAINGAAYDFDSTNFNEYVFTRGAYTLVIDIDKDEKTIIYWYAYYDATYEE